MAKQVNKSVHEHTNEVPEQAQNDVTNEKNVDQATETNHQASVNLNIKPEGTKYLKNAENPEDDEIYLSKFPWLLPDLVA